MKNKKIIYFLVGILFALVSCEKEEDLTKSNNVSNDLSIKIDDKEFIPTSSLCFVNEKNGLTLILNDKLNGLKIETKEANIGSYTIETPNQTVFCEFYYNGIKAEIVSGYFNITSISDNSVIADFELYTGSDLKNGSEKRVTINGKIKKLNKKTITDLITGIYQGAKQTFYEQKDTIINVLYTWQIKKDSFLVYNPLMPDSAHYSYIYKDTSAWFEEIRSIDKIPYNIISYDTQAIVTKNKLNYNIKITNNKVTINEYNDLKVKTENIFSDWVEYIPSNNPADTTGKYIQHHDFSYVKISLGRDIKNGLGEKNWEEYAKFGYYQQIIFPYFRIEENSLVYWIPLSKI